MMLPSAADAVGHGAPMPLARYSHRYAVIRAYCPRCGILALLWHAAAVVMACYCHGIVVPISHEKKHRVPHEALCSQIQHPCLYGYPYGIVVPGM